VSPTPGADRAQLGLDRLALFLLGIRLLLLVAADSDATADGTFAVRPGEKATLTLVTPEGASARLVVVPPERLPANGTVAL